MKSKEELDRWWSGLKVTFKEKIAGTSYPACTAWWNSQSEEERNNLFYAASIGDVTRRKHRQAFAD